MNWDKLRIVSAVLILIAPIAVLTYDLVAFVLCGKDCTLSAVTRDWARTRPWVEHLFVGFVVFLYLHLFRNGVK